MTWFWLSMLLAAAFFSAWFGVPLRLVFKHNVHAAQPVAAQPPAPVCPAEPTELPLVASQRAGELAGVW
jgi:hypothetical protein